MKYSGAQGLKGGLMSPVGRLQRPQMTGLLAPAVSRQAARTMAAQRPTQFNGLRGLRGFAGTGGQQAITGVKTGVSVGTSATAVGAGVASAVGAGAAAGSVVPIIGTAIGAIVGLIASGVFNHRADPEVSNFNQAISVWQASRLNALNIANKYLVLAGLFDLTSGQVKGNIPILKKYGRMGEQKFVTDMCNLIYAAAQAGKITAADTPQTVMSNIVQPWIDSWGYGPMNDSNTDLINLIILGMVAEYIAGGQNRWLAVGGDYPFGNVPKFALPAAAAPAQPAAAQPQGNSAMPISADGSTLQPGQGGTLTTAAGTWSISSNLDSHGNSFVMLNGASTNGGAQVLLVAGGQMHLLNDGGWYAWNNGWVNEAEPALAIQKGLPANTPAGGTPVPATSASLAPAGTTLVAGTPGAMNTSFGVVTLTADGTWQLNGTAIAYTPTHQGGGVGTNAMQWTGTQLQAANSDGWIGYWSGSTWNTLSPGTGTATTTPVTTAPSLTADPYANTAVAPTTYYTDPNAGYVAPAPAAVAPITAGVSGVGLPSWVTWAGILAGVGLMFALGRPVGPSGRSPKKRG